MVGVGGWCMMSSAVSNGSSKLMDLGWRFDGVVVDSPSAIEEMESSY